MISGTPHKRHSGFTLVEIAIVLVIIGLIVGGVLVGRDLIELAQVRAQVSQMEKIDAAINTFKLKYKCIPGDCRVAVESGLGTAGGYGDNGNGNDRLDTENEFYSSYQGIPIGEVGNVPELMNFWYHLSQANLLEGRYPPGTLPGVNSPPLKMAGMGISDTGLASTTNASGGIWFGTIIQGKAYPVISSVVTAWILTASGTTGYIGVYLPRKAYLLDKKLDDGLPNSGKQLTIGNRLANVVCLSPPCPPGMIGGIVNPVAVTVTAGGPDACIDDRVTPAIYNMPVTVRTSVSLCTPVIRASW